MQELTAIRRNHRSATCATNLITAFTVLSSTNVQETWTTFPPFPPAKLDNEECIVSALGMGLQLDTHIRRRVNIISNPYRKLIRSQDERDTRARRSSRYHDAIWFTTLGNHLVSRRPSSDRPYR